MPHENIFRMTWKLALKREAILYTKNSSHGPWDGGVILIIRSFFICDIQEFLTINVLRDNPCTLGNPICVDFVKPF